MQGVIQGGIYVAVLFMLTFFSYTDIKNRTVPVPGIVIFSAAAFLSFVPGSGLTLLQAAGGALTGLVFLVISFLTKGEIGSGDGLVIALTGIYLGFWKNAELLVCALFMCAIYSLVLVVVSRKSKRYEVPFVPFMLAGYVLMLGFGRMVL